jgi:hypothetical protein
MGDQTIAAAQLQTIALRVSDDVGNLKSLRARLATGTGVTMSPSDMAILNGVLDQYSSWFSNPFIQGGSSNIQGAIAQIDMAIKAIMSGPQYKVFETIRGFLADMSESGGIVIGDVGGWLAWNSIIKDTFVSDIGQKAFDELSSRMPMLSAITESSDESVAAVAARPDMRELAMMARELDVDRLLPGINASIQKFADMSAYDPFLYDETRGRLQSHYGTTLLAASLYDPSNHLMQQIGPVGAVIHKAIAATNTLCLVAEKVFFFRKAPTKGFMTAKGANATKVVMTAATSPKLKGGGSGSRILLKLTWPSELRVATQDANAGAMAEAITIGPQGAHNLSVLLDSVEVHSIDFPGSISNSSTWSVVVPIKIDTSKVLSFDFTAATAAGGTFACWWEFIEDISPNGNSMYLTGRDSNQGSDLGSVVGDIEPSAALAVCNPDPKLWRLALMIDSVLGMGQKSSSLYQRIKKYATVTLTLVDTDLTVFTEASVWSIGMWLSGRPTSIAQSDWRRLFAVAGQYVLFTLYSAATDPLLGTHISKRTN